MTRNSLFQLFIAACLLVACHIPHEMWPHPSHIDDTYYLVRLRGMHARYVMVKSYRPWAICGNSSIPCNRVRYCTSMNEDCIPSWRSCWPNPHLDIMTGYASAICPSTFISILGKTSQAIYNRGFDVHVAPSCILLYPAEVPFYIIQCSSYFF